MVDAFEITGKRCRDNIVIFLDDLRWLLDLLFSSALYRFAYGRYLLFLKQLVQLILDTWIWCISPALIETIEVISLHFATRTVRHSSNIQTEHHGQEAVLITTSTLSIRT